ncbi:MAG: hypothetical protein K2K82_08705 [Muribaculaceae bacterium]|nr:hypothetical protein [Muribaculaceae bacterium]
MKERIANLLRKWADKLAPIEISHTLSVENYEIVPISLGYKGKTLWRELPSLHLGLARKIGEEMQKEGMINYQSRPTKDGGLETTATAYVGVRKV